MGISVFASLIGGTLLVVEGINAERVLACVKVGGAGEPASEGLFVGG